MSKESGENVEAYFVVQRVPGGEAPEEIRQAWVGLILPIEPVNIESPRSFKGYGVITRQSYNLDDAVAVAIGSAVDVLEAAGQIEAAEWWTKTAVRHYYDSRCQVKMGNLLFESRDGMVISKAAKERFYPDPL